MPPPKLERLSVHMRFVTDEDSYSHFVDFDPKRETVEEYAERVKQTLLTLHLGVTH